jgi:hypothetical protein
MSTVPASSREGLEGLDKVLEQSSGRLYVDFDFTLFRSSSTEEFLRSGRPAVLAALVSRLTRVLELGTSSRAATPRVWRDAVRTWAVILLMPWTLWLFERRAPELFARLRNRELAKLLESVDPRRVTIVSLGFERFIRQLLRGTALEQVTIVATSLAHPAAIRRVGKLAYLSKVECAPRRDTDIVISDSLDDADLLGSVAHAYRIEPDLAGVDGKWRDVYVPFDYTARVKRSPAFVIKQIFLEELPVVLLATALFQPLSMQVWAGAALLFVAFLVIYEVGYAENDRVGRLIELEPKLAPNFDELKHAALEPAAWFWALGFTAAGTWLLGEELASEALARVGVDGYAAPLALPLAMLLWLGVVALGRGTFYVYNRLPTAWRVFAYVALHVVKYFGLVVFLPSQAVGYALLCAQLVRTWSLYAIRRCGGDVELIASQLVRLVFLLVLLFALTLAAPSSSALGDWHAWVILAWCAARALPEARRKLFSSKGRRSGLRAVRRSGLEPRTDRGNGNGHAV